MNKSKLRVCVVGAGMSGVLMTIRLMQAGYTNIVVIEKGRSVGGTWRDNTYPGLHCDVPSVSYCYSFAPNNHWSKRMSSGADIKAYFENTAQQYGVNQYVQFNTEVKEARYVDGEWQVTTNRDQLIKADFLIAACGVLHHPVIPDFEGRDSFKGASFHTARWDHSVSLAGKKVGVIGTGSTAVQMVKPVSREASELKLFQRTPQWIFPIPNRRYTKLDKTIAQIPWMRKTARDFWDQAFDQGAIAVTRKGWQRQAIQSICRLHLQRIKDPELRQKLTPDYEPLCKRMIMNTDFYSAVQNDNVELVTNSIKSVEPEGIRLNSGRLVPLDVLVYATGFDTQAYVRPMKLIGIDDYTLDEAWQNGPKAYRTIAQPGFPNFFMIQGPNAPVGNFSLVSTAETQTQYIMKCIDLVASGRCDALVPKQAAMDKFNSDLAEAMNDTVWVSGCQSWYIGPDGVPLSWPWGPKEFRESMREPDLADFSLLTNSQLNAVAVG